MRYTVVLTAEFPAMTREILAPHFDLIQQVMPLILANEVAWTVVGAPTKGWADSVGVESPPEGERRRSSA